MSRRPYLTKATRQRIRKLARNRCGYCLAPQQFFSCRFPVEHIIPHSRKGTSSEENLWLSCPASNWYKGPRTHARDIKTGKIVPLFNPRLQSWKEHFAWSQDGTRIIGHTAVGRTTVSALKLNNQLAIEARRLWVLADKFPPSDSLT